jgi:site-specific DNA recombinase
MKKKRGVIYTRVSSNEQVSNFSLETQRRACVDYCDREEIEVDTVFSDAGESAKTANRPELQRLLAYCDSNRKLLDFVIVYDVSRFCRNVQDHVLLRAALKKLGISLRAATQQFDDTSTGELVEFLLSGLAHFDNRQRADRTVAGMRAALAKGRWTHQPPLGFLKPPHRDGPSLIADPDRGPLVRLAFERMATGRFKKREVLDELTALGLRTRRGEMLSLQTFGSMLRNRLYAGIVRVPKWEFEGPGDFEPLVDSETFHAVQSLLDGRRISPERRNRDHPDFPLRRFVRCGVCDSPLTGSWSRGRKDRYPYYRCSNSGCKAVNVRKERIEEVFIHQLKNPGIRPDVLSLFFEIVRDAWKAQRAEVTGQAARLKTRLQEIEQRTQHLINAFVYESKIDKATYNDQRTRLAQEASTVQAQINAGKSESLDLERSLEFARGVLTDPAGSWHSLTPEQRPGFQQAIYPSGLTYYEGRIGTAKTSWAFTHLEGELETNNGMASPTGLEPVLPP